MTLRIQAEALTEDDVSLVPAHSTVLPKDVSLETRLTRDLRIRLPIASAAMDTVSEARLAVAMAQQRLCIGSLQSSAFASDENDIFPPPKSLFSGSFSAKPPYLRVPNIFVGDASRYMRIISCAKSRGLWRARPPVQFTMAAPTRTRFTPCNSPYASARPGWQDS